MTIENPYAIIDRRFNRLESLLLEIRQAQLQAPSHSLEVRYRDFKWLKRILPHIAESSLRQLIAKGIIPGVSKIGKKLTVDEVIVLEWIASNKRKSDEAIAEDAEDSFNQQHIKRHTGGRVTT